MLSLEHPSETDANTVSTTPFEFPGPQEVSPFSFLIEPSALESLPMFRGQENKGNCHVF